MADPAPDIASAATSSAPPLTDLATDDSAKKAKALAGITNAYETKIGADAAIEAKRDRQDAQTRAQMEKMVNAEGASIDELKNVWKPEQHEQHTNLWEQFGSPGFLVAMMGSAFSAMPMNSALAAGGAAIEAIHRGDDEAYNRAYKAWQDNTKLAIDRIRMEHETFEDFDHLRDSDLHSWTAKAAAALAKFNDQRKLALLQAGMLPEYDEARKGEIEAAKQLEETKRYIEENKELADAIKAKDAADAKKNKEAGGVEQPTPEQHWKNHNDAIAEMEAAKAKRYGAAGTVTMAKEQAQTMEDVKAQLKKDHPDWAPGKIDLEAAKQVKEAYAPPITGNKRLDAEAHLGLYDDATKLIDGIESTLHKYTGAAGAAGYVTRAGETVSNILGGNETDRKQLERDINQLQLVAPQLLLDRTTGRPLSAEHAAISKIIGGLNMGDTTANTLRSMEEIRDRLEAIKRRGAARLETGDKPAGSSQPPADTKGWDAYPLVK